MYHISPMGTGACLWAVGIINGDREVWTWAENLHLPLIGNGQMHLIQFILELFIKQAYIWSHYRWEYGALTKL